MYCGIRLDSLNVNSYGTALAALAQRARKSRKVKEADCVRPSGTEAPLGHPRSEVTGVRMGRDEEIRFRLYSTDVVVWWPDGSVEIENYGSVTTSAFANTLLPHRVYLPKREELVCFNGMVCKGSIVRLEQVDGFWQADESTIDTIRYPVLNRKLAREVRQQYHLRDFEEWVTVGSAHFRIEHENYHLRTCAEALEQRDFRTAAAHMPAIDLYSKAYRGFGIRDRASPLLVACRNGEVVLPSCFQHLANALYEDEGAFDTIERKVMSAEEFERRERKARQLDRWTRSSWGVS